MVDTAGRVRPVHKGVWDSTVSYNILNIVTDANRYAAYIALQDVPAGTELSEGPYWDILCDMSGAGIDNVSISESTEDKGANVVTITMGDGSVKTFNVLNGSKGSTGSKGETGPQGAPGKTAYQYAQDAGYTGTEAQFAAKMAMPVITPEMYGAVGDGSTDDSAAIQAAIDAAADAAVLNDSGTIILQPVVTLKAAQYKISNGLIFENPRAQFNCDGRLIYDGTGAAVSIKHGMCNIYINIIEAPNGTAVLFTTADHQVNANNLTVNRIESSVTGLHLLENSSKASYHCMSYNKIRIYGITASGTGVLLEENGITWLTENWFFLGSIGGGASTGIKIVAVEGVEIGGNRFFHGGLEDLADDAVGIWLGNTSGNTFEDFRTAENYGNMLVKFVGNCGGNDIATSLMPLGGIDISEMTGGLNNILRGDVATGKPYSGGYSGGIVAKVSYAHGITYDPINANINVTVTADTYADNVIRQNTADGLKIPTTFGFASTDTDGLTYTLGALYSEYGSMARGFPVVFRFGTTGGKIFLKGYRGDTILDNTSGKYSGKNVLVRWTGHDKVANSDVWEVREVGTTYESTANKTTKILVSSTDEQYPTAKAVYDALSTVEAAAPEFAISENGHLLQLPDGGYTNQMPISIDTDGSVYNDIGYKDGYRMNSSGTETERPGSVVTGYIPFEVGDVIFTKGISFGAVSTVDGNWIDGYVSVFDSSFNPIGVYNASGAKTGVVSGCTVTEGDGGILTIAPTFTTGAAVAYVRVSGAGTGTSLIIAVNEEIKESTTEDIGRIAPILKGEYDSETAYEQCDVVTYDTALYWHHSATATKGVAPTDSTVWGKIAQDGAQGSTGATGQRGTGLLPVTTAPASYTTAVGGITPKYRMAISTIKTQAGATEVLLGDTVRYSYYHYPVAYLDASYAYFTARVSIRGATGAAYTLTDADKTSIAAEVKDSLTSETWTFTLADGSTATKVVLLG